MPTKHSVFSKTFSLSKYNRKENINEENKSHELQSNSKFKLVFIYQLDAQLLYSVIYIYIYIYMYILH
jgi:hypothetical protein